MTSPAPNHHDAELVPKVYELRRGPVMQELGNAINSEFLPRSFEEFMAVTKPDQPLNAACRQTSSYSKIVHAWRVRELSTRTTWWRATAKESSSLPA